MIRHFFGGKRQLFIAAMQLPGEPRESLPRLIEAGIEGLGTRLDD